MLIKQNGMTYDQADPRCQCFVAETSATTGVAPSVKVAFITIVDDRSQCLKRYFGLFDWEVEEASIRAIMMDGGQWPLVFRDIAQPQGESLDC